jgi:UDP:flavonoid glycosyltransferase YjiC (YdhE family)
VRVLFTTQPAYGHLHPLVPAARALADAGHDVVFASSASFQPQLRATGLGAMTAGLDWLESRFDLAFPEIITHAQAGTAKEFMIAEVFCTRTARQMAADIVQLAETWRPDIVVREYSEFGGGIAAAALGTPCVLHGLGLWVNIEEFANAGGAALRIVAAERGVLDDDLGWIDGDLYLDPCPPFLQAPAQRPYPAESRLIRPVPFDTTTGPDAVPPWIDHLQGDRPVIYVGLGTVMDRQGVTIKTILDDLRELDAELIVTTGPGRRPENLGAQPPHVHIEQYLPLTQLLPHCDLVVCHGGWGTVIGALSHGIPVACVPISADGFINAERCEAAGVGRTIPAQELQPGLVILAVQTILQQSTYWDPAQRARSQIADMPHPNQIVPAIENLA